uniref:NB-ARC domain-containing protein n=1 Tax=Leersia perrieri TaxID=77586 RepID=A0A0D9WYD2_9ORYZ
MEGGQPPAVSASMGVMDSLLSKLNTSKDVATFKNVKNDLNSLKDELGDMKALMGKFAAQDEMDVQVKEWMRQVREVGYDTEDWIDSHPQQLTAGGFFNRNNRRSKLAELIKELKGRVKDASKRRSRYMLLNAPDVQEGTDDLGSSNVTVDPRLLYGIDGGLVGLQAPINELVTKLRPAGTEQQQFRVGSIVGAGGLGKTTLAMEVYRTIRGEFDCCAFVSVGQNPHIRAVLLDMLHQLNPQPQQCQEDDTEKQMDEPTAVAKLREFLEKKRYLITIDDIWTISAWKDIKCALPENTPGSRIVTTTRINDVAKSCSIRPTDFTYVMKPLNETDSKQLFLSRLQFVSKEAHFETDLEEVVFGDVWKICGGMPLAMIVMAGMLSRKSPYEDEEAIKEALEKYPTLQGMRRILRICYSDLSLPVKTCLLYLSIFPEGATVKKKRVIWRWIAEGFVPKQEQVTSWETAESYFNDLVSRRLIQAVDSGDVVKVKVHDVVLEFIASVAAEENLVTPGMVLRSRPRDVVRRASINSTDQYEASVGGLTQVRSLTVLGPCAKPMMSSVVYLQLLRVLDVKHTTGLTDDHIQGIERLFFLRYLGLGGKGVTKLPEKWKELQNLETLDVSETSVTELPEAIARRCKQLACLLASKLDVGEEIMDSMQQLEELSMVSVNDAASLHRMTNLVVSLTKLRTLGVTWSFDGTDDQNAQAALAASLLLIQNCSVEWLLLDVGEGKTRFSLDLLVDSWAPPRRLCKFSMVSSHYYFPKAPPKMASHESLAHLDISIAVLTKRDLDVFRSMPSLIYLKLRTKSSPPTLQTVDITNQGFQSLQVWWFSCQDGGLGFDFAEGAMPQLLKLHLHFTAGKQVNISSISNLCSLQQLHATVRCGEDDSEFKATEETIKQLVSEHSNKLTYEVNMELDKPATTILIP